MSSGPKIAKIINHGNVRFKVTIPRKLAGSIIRKFFPTHSEAQQWADDFAVKIKRYGTDSIKHEGISVKEAITRFFSVKQLDGRHAKTARSWLNRFASTFSSTPLEFISALDLQKWWTGLTPEK